MKIDDLTIILLAAGRGTRLTPYTKKTAKVLLKIDDETLIEKNINIVKNKLKKKEVHIIVGHYADEIINYLNSRKISGIKIIYHRISEKVLMEGISSSLLQISDIVNNYFLVMFGDEIYLNSDHDKMLEEISKRADFDIYCMIKEANSPDEILKNYSVGISNEEIVLLKEKPIVPINNYIGLGTIVCSKNVLKIIKSAPKQIHFIDALNHGIQNGLKAFYFLSRCEYCNINDKDDYFLAKYLFRSKNMDNCKKSLIIPAYNESKTIGYVVKDFKKYVSEIIVMDNESPDGTGEIAKNAGAKVISKKYKGYGDAIRQGLKEADGDILVITEADATFLANDITKLLEYLKDSDAVIGTRTHRDFIQNNANMDYLLRIGNYLYGKIISLLWWDRRVRLSDVGCTYRALWRSSYEDIKDRLESNGPEFSPEMIVELLNSYLRIIEIPLSYCRRKLGESKISKSKWHSFIVALRMMHLILRKRLRSWTNNLRFIVKRR